MIVEDVQIQNNLEKNLAGRIYKAENKTGAGVIFSHGLFSNKDGYKITRLAQDIVSSKRALLTFDFSFSGDSGNRISDISLNQEVHDLACAVDYFKKRGIRTLHLMGSSMGALVSLLYASLRRTAIASLILIATPVDIKRVFMPGKENAGIDLYPDSGTTIVDNIPIKNAFFRELFGIDMAEALKKIEAPVLAIHGGRDDVVDPDNVALMEKYLPTRLNKIIIEDGDHNLTTDSAMSILRGAIVPWLEKF
jgi:uncharacterized protein